MERSIREAVEFGLFVGVFAGLTCLAFDAAEFVAKAVLDGGDDQGGESEPPA